MSRGLMIALVSALLVMALGVAGIAVYVFVVMPGQSTEATADRPESYSEAKAEGFYQLKKFVTNLSDKEKIRYIDVSVALGMAGAESEAVVVKMEPQVRHVILSQIRAMSSADLLGAEGKDRLAEAIQKGLAEITGLRGHVVKVYVTDMVIQ